MIKSNTLNLIVPLIVSVFMAFSCSSSSKQNCDVKEVKTLFTIPGVYEGKVKGYAHYALVKNFSRQCLDSTSIIKMAIKYKDTTTVGKPVDILMLFNSDKDFIPHETSQDMAEINKSCLVVISFSEKTGRPDEFIFYNEKGERIYWGQRWLPNAK